MSREFFGHSELDIKKLYSGILYDTLNFDFSHSNSTLGSYVSLRHYRSASGDYDRKLYGYAFTCLGSVIGGKAVELYDKVRIDMLRSVDSDSIQIISYGCVNHVPSNVALYGDISAICAKMVGIRGAVVGGYIRDLDKIGSMGFPVACMGTCPVDAYGRWAIVDYQKPAVIKTVSDYVTFNPGDFVFCDGDGVIAVPQGIASFVLDYALERLYKEDKIRSELNNVDCEDVVGHIESVYNKYGRW